MLTNWGYSIDIIGNLPALLSVDEFNTMTAGKYATDSRVATTLSSVSSAIRSYVGWHLAGEYSCELELSFDDLHIVRNGRDIDIRLPVGYVTGVSHIFFDAKKEDGIWDGMEFMFTHKANGLIRVYNVPQCFERYSKVVILFTAGLSDEFAMGIKSIVAQKTSHILSAPTGITNETAGGVSISYSANYVNSAKTSLLTDDKEALLPFKVTELL